MFKRLAMLGLVAGAVALLAGCAPQIRQNGDYRLQREAIARTHQPPPQPLNVGTGQQNQTLANATAPATQYGTGVFINPAPARGAPGGGANQGGTITFNFDNQPVQAAVKAILGDVLHVNYMIAPEVQGTVTFSTSQPVTQDEVLPILQMLLSWTGNAMVSSNGRYLVVPLKQAAAGTLVPGLGAVSPGAGYAAQLFPLHYVSAAAMQKLLKPFADPKAFLLVDPIRNLLVMGGTPDELANYRRTIQTFDVDWLRGMSVAVIPLQHVQAVDLVGQLESLLSTEQGEKGERISGLIRLIPLKQSNSLVIITPQPSYIDEVRRLVTTIDNGAGDSSGLYVYNVLNVKAASLAKHLNELFGNAGGEQQFPSGAVAPGFSPLEQTSPGSLGAQQAFGSFTPSSGTGGNTFGGGDMGAGMVEGVTQGRRGQQLEGGQDTFAFTTGEGVRIAAVNENNQLLVRATPGQWEKLLPVIQRLDEKPLQVQIETRVLEVSLTGQFQFGVQYFLGQFAGVQPSVPANASPFGLLYWYSSQDVSAVVTGMESTGDVKVLSAPSTVVLNNQQATFKVGEKIPVVQTAIIPGINGGTDLGTANATSVNYIDTGVLLDVVPRVSPGGLVYMDIQQVVSKPTSRDEFGNYTIANRAFSTEVAVQSGQTVLLGGLIQQTDSDIHGGIPLLSRIPGIGALFGNTDHQKSRTELIVLITPRVIRDPEDARRVTDEYQTQFESLRPILPGGSESLSGGTEVNPAAATNTVVPVEADRWVVEVASSTDSSAAQRLVERLKQYGYESYVAGRPAGAGMNWRVFAGPVADRAAAESLLDAIRASVHIDGMSVHEL